jgi:RNA polymerase sigma factor (TIGR02999 family)
VIKDMPEIKGSAQATALSNTADRERLFAALYSELRRTAQRELRRNAAVPLSPTTLVHETFLSMSRSHAAAFPDRARFMAYAGSAMRGLLIDHLRNRQALKRGAQYEITALPLECHAELESMDADKLGTALDELFRLQPRLAECVDLKFFCGFSYADIAQLWEVSERTVQREWEKARIILFRLMKDSDTD